MLQPWHFAWRNLMTSQFKKKPEIEELQNIPWLNITGFHTDLQSRVETDTSLESLRQKNAQKPSMGPDGPDQRTTTIYKKNEAYYVYFNICELDSNYGDNLTSFSLWLMSLSENDKIYIHQTGSIWNLTGLVQIIGILGTECKARKIFVVDHPIENALFLLSCDEVMITEFGALTFSNAMDIDPSKWDLIYMPYIKSLFAKAVERNYISSDEVNAVLNDNAIIFKTARELKNQGVSIV